MVSPILRCIYFPLVQSLSLILPRWVFGWFPLKGPFPLFQGWVRVCFYLHRSVLRSRPPDVVSPAVCVEPFHSDSSSISVWSVPNAVPRPHPHRGKSKLVDQSPLFLVTWQTWGHTSNYRYYLNDRFSSSLRITLTTILGRTTRVFVW